VKIVQEINLDKKIGLVRLYFILANGNNK